MDKWILISTLIIAFFVAIMALRPWLRALPAGVRARLNPAGLISRFILMPVRARVVATIIPLIVLCWSIYMIAMHGAVGIYWATIISAVSLTTVAAIFYEPLRNRYENCLHQLRHNNNWRSGLLFVLAIMFSLSALIAGFGEPILTRETAKIATPAREYLADDSSTVSKEINYILFGKHEPLLKKVEEVKEEKKDYPGWWHWKAAFTLWFIAIPYFFIAIREEVAAAWHEATEKIGKIASAVTAGSADVTTQAPPQAAPAGATARPIHMKDSFLRLFSIDVLAEFFPILLNKVIQTIFKGGR